MNVNNFLRISEESLYGFQNPNTKVLLRKLQFKTTLITLQDIHKFYIINTSSETKWLAKKK